MGAHALPVPEDELDEWREAARAERRALVRTAGWIAFGGLMGTGVGSWIGAQLFMCPLVTAMGADSYVCI